MDSIKNAGRPDIALEAFYEYKNWERKNYPAWEKLPVSPFIWIFNNLNWLICGFGVRPLRIFPTGGVIIIVFALLYYLLNPTGLQLLRDPARKFVEVYPSQFIISVFKLSSKFFSSCEVKVQNKHKIYSVPMFFLFLKKCIITIKKECDKPFDSALFQCIYFSATTFSTLGFGDIDPCRPATQMLATIQSLLGWFCLGLFVTTYANVLLGG
ncbi:MAG: potassium channel family protein [Candidatus Scalindua sp.]|nr:potassium channel family protein [Candidatus Scalindua sp.]